jgi:deoxycytidine triphosphate deaminase
MAELPPDAPGAQPNPDEGPSAQPPTTATQAPAQPAPPPVIDPKPDVAGGVLGTAVIRDRRQEIFTSGYSDDCVQAASYDLRVANTKMILPRGRRIPDGSIHDRPFVLQPGDVAFVSTDERLRMPEDLSGNISIKFTYAIRGILVLTGMIVDPGYGSDLNEGRRLHFVIANVGQEPLPIHPGTDRIASIQFLPVLAGKDKTPSSAHRLAKSPSLIDDLFIEHELPLGLSFFESQARLERHVDQLDTKIDESVRGLGQVVLFGYFLLATVIAGVVLTFLLGWVNDSTLQRRLRLAIDLLPHNLYGVISLIVIGLMIFVGLPYLITRASRVALSRQRSSRR